MSKLMVLYQKKIDWKPILSIWTFYFILFSFGCSGGGSCENKATEFNAVGPRGNLIHTVNLIKATSEEQLGVSILQQLTPICTKANTSIAKGSSVGSIPISEYTSLLKNRDRIETLVEELNKLKASSPSWVGEAHIAYSHFLREYDIAVFQNPDIKVATEIKFLDRTSEIIGPYEEVVPAVKELEAITEKVNSVIPSLSVKYDNKNYDFSENQKKLLQEIFMEAPSLSRDFKRKYPNTTGGEEHIRLISSFFIQALMLSSGK